MNTGYKQATIAYYVSYPSNEPLDVDGNLVRLSDKKQAILLLEGFENPDTNKYEIAGYFKAGDRINGEPTRVYNPGDCPISVEGFITVSPNNINLPTNTSFIYVTVNSSHSWEIENLVYLINLLEFDIVSGGPGETKIKITAIGVGGFVSILFKNIVTNDTTNLKVDINEGYQKGKISSIYHEYSADPNGSGTEGTWLTTPRDWDTPPYNGANDNFGSNDPSNNTPWRLNGINKQTLQTVEIGEHVFTRQNFMFKYRYDKPQNYANVTQEEIDEAFVTTPVQIAETYDQSRYYNGAYTLCDAVVYDAVNTGVFYNNRTDRVETDRFKIPTAGDYAQMLSMADDTTYQGILQFVAVKPAKTDTQGTIIENGGDEQLPYPYDHIWENTTDSWDLSGLHLVPSARRYNAGNGDLTGAFYAYRKSVGLRIANEDGTLSSSILAIYSNADSNTAGVALNNGSTYHLASVRLCRRKTTQELGYQLYADTANDKVIVTPWDAPAPLINDIKLEPIPIGRLRGISVRYLNADKTQVLASLSSLQAKVELTNTGKGRWSGFDNY